jgi:hypothetical protein
MFRVKTVDVCQDNKFAGRNCMRPRFQPIKPTGRDPLSVVSFLLRIKETTFFDLSQGQLPLLSGYPKRIAHLFHAPVPSGTRSAHVPEYG